MKKIKIISVVASIVFLLSACSSSTATFNGSRTGNDDQLIMEYSILNTTDYQMLELEEGDVVDFEIVSESGKVNVSLQKEGEEPVYEGNDVSTTSFKVTVAEGGTYKASVTGKKAKGSVSIVKEKNN